MYTKLTEIKNVPGTMLSHNATITRKRLTVDMLNLRDLYIS
jgi:hypothetical protein